MDRIPDDGRENEDLEDEMPVLMQYLVTDSLIPAIRPNQLTHRTVVSGLALGVR